MSIKIAAMKPRVYLLLLSVGLFSCQTKNNYKSQSQFLEKALKAESFLKTAQVIDGTGTSWKVMPDSTNSVTDVSLYSGSPGVILFYLELYNTTDSEQYLNLARSGASHLLQNLDDITPNANNVGLYTGLAGMGYTLMELYRATNDKSYLRSIFTIVDLLASSAEVTSHGVHWGNITDIVYGGAGIGLFLNSIANESGLEKADSLAAHIANQLLVQSTKEADGLRWKMRPVMDRHMDNFSHGTAGVAYFLAERYKMTQEVKFLEAALKAGNWLAEHTNEEGLVAHHYPGGEDLYYLSWCHGPAGTSRLYYSLWELTSERKWMDLMVKSADGMMEMKIDQQRTPGFWNNVGKCCGDAGVAEYYLWLYEITGDEDYLNFSKTLTHNLLLEATYDGDVLKWIHAENRVSPEQVAAQTGLMQGAAGIGLWLLQLHNFEKGKKNLIQLPDKPSIR